MSEPVTCEKPRIMARQGECPVAKHSGSMRRKSGSSAKLAGQFSPGNPSPACIEGCDSNRSILVPKETKDSSTEKSGCLKSTARDSSVSEFRNVAIPERSAEGSFEMQPEDVRRRFAAKGLSAVEGLPRRHVGRQVPGPQDREPHADGSGTGEDVAECLRSLRRRTPKRYAAKGAISAGTVQEMSDNLKLVTRESYGFRTSRVSKLVLPQIFGKLTEPDRLHEFC